LGEVREIPSGFSPTVRSNIYPRGLQAETNKCPRILFFQSGKYLKAAGIFAEVINCCDNVYELRRVNSDDLFYMARDGDSISWGETLQNAKVDLLFKTGKREFSEFTQLTKSDSLAIEEAIVCYREITGACREGIHDFILNRLGEKKSRYRISEIIHLTRGEWHNKKFSEFFEQ